MKGKVLRELLVKRGEFISGQDMGLMLKISRAAVWKHINALRDEGYRIESVSSKGYRLLDSPDILVPEEIRLLLETSFIGHRLVYRDSVDSTNALAKSIAPEEQEGTVVVAEEQTEGRGRMGRHWISPSRTGIWMSVILKPRIRPDKAYQITQVAAVAVVKSIKRLTGLSAGIKWPNDIVIDGKKVCGILTEMNAEPDMVNYIVLGMGINVNLSSRHIPPPLKDKATSLKEEMGVEVSRKELFLSLLSDIEESYTSFLKGGFKAIIGESRKFSVVLGREIRVIQGKVEHRGKAIDIREDGVLLLQNAEGVVEIISGDVSVRGMEGYL